MKRIQIATSSCQPQLSEFTERPISESSLNSEVGFKHSLFVPLHYEKKYAYPLLVWLHGADDNERQLKRVMPGISLRNYVAVAPRGTANCIETNTETFCWRQNEAEIIEAQWRLTASIERVQSRYNIHRDRIFVGGYADGGTMALRLALRMPHLCAGVISIGGSMPNNLAPLLNIERARGLSVLLMQGNSSSDYSTSEFCRDLRVLHSAGMSVAARQYPAGDELTTKMLSDVDSWLMERVTGDPAESSHALCDRRERN